MSPGNPLWSFGQSWHIPSKKERWSEGHKYAKTHNFQGVCSKTVFAAGHQEAGPDMEVRYKREADLLSLCQAITCTVFGTDWEIGIRALCATYQHEHRVTVPQTFCPNNHSKNWEGKLCFANGQSKKLSCLSFQKQLQGQLLEKTTRHGQDLFLHN